MSFPPPFFPSECDKEIVLTESRQDSLAGAEVSWLRCIGDCLCQGLFNFGQVLGGRQTRCLFRLAETQGRSWGNMRGEVQRQNQGRNNAEEKYQVLSFFSTGHFLCPILFPPLLTNGLPSFWGERSSVSAQHNQGVHMKMDAIMPGEGDPVR